MLWSFHANFGHHLQDFIERIERLGGLRSGFLEPLRLSLACLLAPFLLFAEFSHADDFINWRRRLLAVPLSKHNVERLGVSARRRPAEGQLLGLGRVLETDH
jgi:hypothetical protein